LEFYELQSNGWTIIVELGGTHCDIIFLGSIVAWIVQSTCLEILINCGINKLHLLGADRANAAGPPEETFLRRLLDRGATETRTIKESNSVEMGLASRKSSTIKTMKMLVQAIDIQRAKNEELAASLRGLLSADGLCFYGDLFILCEKSLDSSSSCAREYFHSCLQPIYI
jgi:hypothetical protein